MGGNDITVSPVLWHRELEVGSELELCLSPCCETLGPVTTSPSLVFCEVEIKISTQVLVRIHWAKVYRHACWESGVPFHLKDLTFWLGKYISFNLPETCQKATLGGCGKKTEHK